MARLKLGKTIGPVIRGDTLQIDCIFKQSDGTTAINLDGGTAYFTVNSDDDPSSDTSAVIQKTATSATPFTSASTGEHTFTLTHSDTDITPGEYWYDSQFIDAVGNYVSCPRGKFIIQSDTTRS